VLKQYVEGFNGVGEVSTDVTAREILMLEIRPEHIQSIIITKNQNMDHRSSYKYELTRQKVRDEKLC
jgi:hypothetical protein